jgi:hypothetical protein
MFAYQAVTAHFVTVDWVLATCLISFAELDGRHTGENMAPQLLSVIAEMLGISKVCLCRLLKACAPALHCTDIRILDWVDNCQQCE